jgi:putative nucleotidyltransferase with HDIG domain
MSIPTRPEACRVLVAADPTPRLLRHVTAVAEIAGSLGALTAARGIDVNRRLIESAALLHDVDKALKGTARPPGEHGISGAAWLTGRGYSELAPAVANHPVSTLGDDDRYAWFQAHATREVRIVAYADKRAAQRLQPLDSRFARWFQRHPELRNVLERARERAAELEAQVCADAGITPNQVRRLRWVAAAMRESAP